MEQTRVFWDIEREKTTSIYFIFIFLILIYFVSFFLLWTILKLFYFLRVSLENPHYKFSLFGTDTIIVLIFALIIGIIHWCYTNSNAVRKILKLLNAHTIDKNDRYHYIFQNIVNEMSVASGNLNVEAYIIPTIAMNAFALQDLSGRRIIGATEGLISRLNRDELQAVIAHEVAHLVSNDALITTIASSIFGIFSEILNGIASNLERLSKTEIEYEAYFQKTRQNALTAGILSIPIFLSILFFSLLSQLLYVSISREKEYRADANAIKYTRNPIALARALYKIANHYRGSTSQLAPIFILSPETNPLEEREDFFSNLFSTHPPLTRRLQIILEQAHTDVSILYEKNYKQKVAEPIPDTGSQIFFIKKEDKILGPYNLLQLQTIEWLNPDSEILFGENKESITADKIPALNHFFKIRNEPIWKMRRLCPICNEWLVIQEYEGLYVWRCAFCDGLLVEKEKLPRIFVRNEKGFSEEVIHRAELIMEESKQKKPHFRLIIETLEKRKCPKCGKQMIRKFYSYAYHIEIDECPECNLVWFDKDELEILQYLLEKEENNGKG
uniref:Peptidase M48 domain-containing protein n=1 Tax=candidate division WOR-3 bacterium TaxID=2052148 RepID=A0A7V3RFZ6_UNCW3